MNYSQDSMCELREKETQKVERSALEKFEERNNDFMYQVNRAFEYSNHTLSFFSRFIPARFRSQMLQRTMERMRRDAYQDLVREVAALDNNREKLELLNRAKKMPLFKMHRSNFCLFGAFGRTRTVSYIDALIKGLTQEVARKIYR